MKKFMFYFYISLFVLTGIMWTLTCNKIIQPSIISYSNKVIIDLGVRLLNNKDFIYDSSELWKASLYNFSKSKEYIEKNGNLVPSIYELPSQELQQIVSEKLQQQLGVPDTLGVIFQPDSSLVQKINNSDTIKRYFLENSKELFEGKSIKISNIYFDLTENLNLGTIYRNPNILFTFVSENGSFNSLILDIYCFKRGENVIVEMLRLMQDTNIISNYYTLSLIIIPLEEWGKW